MKSVMESASILFGTWKILRSSEIPSSFPNTSWDWNENSLFSESTQHCAPMWKGHRKTKLFKKKESSDLGYKWPEAGGQPVGICSLRKEIVMPIISSSHPLHTPKTGEKMSGSVALQSSSFSWQLINVFFFPFLIYFPWEGAERAVLTGKPCREHS